MYWTIVISQNLVEEKDKKVKELQDHIAAVTFTPQSKMGKMLMAKCRTLQEENEEIGNQANEGKVMGSAFSKRYFIVLINICSLCYIRSCSLLVEPKFYRIGQRALEVQLLIFSLLIIVD